MNTLIGFMSALILLICYHFFERNRQVKLGASKYYFIFYLIFCSYLYNPLENPLGWLGWLLLFYCVLDDWVTGSALFVPISILVTLIFVIIKGNLYFLLISVFVFIIFLIFSKLTKEKYICEGDAYFILPTFYVLSESHPFIGIYLMFVFGGIFTIFTEIYKRRKPDSFSQIHFSPFMALATILVSSNWNVVTITFISTLLAIPSCLIVLYLNKHFKILISFLLISLLLCLIGFFIFLKNG